MPELAIMDGPVRPYPTVTLRPWDKLGRAKTKLKFRVCYCDDHDAAPSTASIQTCHTGDPGDQTTRLLAFKLTH